MATSVDKKVKKDIKSLGVTYGRSAVIRYLMVKGISGTTAQLLARGKYSHKLREDTLSLIGKLSAGKIRAHL